MAFRTDSISQVSKGTRALARRREIDYFEAVRRILYQENSTHHAIDLATEAYQSSRRRDLLTLLGDLYVIAGEALVAESIFRSAHSQGITQHITNLIYAGIPATVALVDESKKMLFVPIPKCASSTVKNYFSVALFGEYFGEMVHFQHPELYRIVTAEDLATTFRDYHRFAVVRDPISRLTSYFIHNIKSGSLAKEAFGRQEFMEYATRPGPRQVRKSFHAYRQLFKDFRHHTDPACGFLDPIRSELDTIYQMSDLEELRHRIERTYGCELEDKRAMVSQPDADLKAELTEVFKALEPFYTKDYDSLF